MWLYAGEYIAHIVQNFFVLFTACSFQFRLEATGFFALAGGDTIDGGRLMFTADKGGKSSKRKKGKRAHFWRLLFVEFGGELRAELQAVLIRKRRSLHLVGYRHRCISGIEGLGAGFYGGNERHHLLVHFAVLGALRVYAFEGMIDFGALPYGGAVAHDISEHTGDAIVGSACGSSVFARVGACIVGAGRSAKAGAGRRRDGRMQVIIARYGRCRLAGEQGKQQGKGVEKTHLLSFGVIFSFWGVPPRHARAKGARAEP